MGFPEIPKDVKGSLRQRDVSILVPLAPVDVDKHAVGVDIRDLQVRSFPDAQTKGVYDGEAGLVMGEPHRVQDVPDFVPTQNHRQGFLFFGSDEFEGGPFAFEGVGEEEFDAAQRNCACGSGPFSYIFVVEKVLPEFLFGDRIRRFFIMFCQMTHGSDVHVDGSFGHAAELQIVD